jgi:hypothetical protein
VVNDLDFDFDARSFKSGKKNVIIAAFAAIPALAGGGYALTRMDAPAEAAPMAAAAPVKTATPWVPPAPVAAAAPTPTPPETKSDSASSGNLSEDMKKALLANDSNRTAAKAKARSSAPSRKAVASSGKKGGSNVFKAGGAATDPLNSKL